MAIKNTQDFKVIMGHRDELEAALARALFSADQSEIDRLINQLNQISLKQPSLKLLKIDD